MTETIFQYCPGLEVEKFLRERQNKPY